MLEGINVLNETVVYEVIFNFKIALFVIILSGVVGFMSVLASNGGFAECIFAGIISGLGGMIISIPILLLTAKTTDEIDYITYQVTIDETVSFTEFNERYELIKQEGTIYTIKERKE